MLLQPPPQVLGMLGGAGPEGGLACSRGWEGDQRPGTGDSAVRPGLLGWLQRQVSGMYGLWRAGVGGAGAAGVKYSNARLSNRMFPATFSSFPDMLNTPGLGEG